MNKQVKTYMEQVNEIEAACAAYAKGKGTDDALARVAFFFAGEIRRAKSKLLDWQTRCALNPLNAFEWADGAVEAAATLDTYSRLGHNIERLHMEPESDRTPEQTLEHIKTFATREAIRFARDPAHSTGQVSNLSARYVGAAYAKILDAGLFN